MVIEASAVGTPCNLSLEIHHVGVVVCYRFRWASSGENKDGWSRLGLCRANSDNSGVRVLTVWLDLSMKETALRLKQWIGPFEAAAANQFLWICTEE